MSKPLPPEAELVLPMPSPPTIACPTCSTPMRPSSRYPRAICNACASRATDAAGRPLTFSNRSISGGFIARYRDTGEEYLGHTCYVDGRECYADEARFGGVVVQLSS